MSDDIDALLVTAWLRRERRLAAFAALRDGFPTPAYWRALDLVHEASRLIDSLERRRVYLPTIPRYDHTWVTR